MWTPEFNPWHSVFIIEIIKCFHHVLIIKSLNLVFLNELADYLNFTRFILSTELKQRVIKIQFYPASSSSFNFFSFFFNTVSILNVFWTICFHYFITFKFFFFFTFLVDRINYTNWYQNNYTVQNWFQILRNVFREKFPNIEINEKTRLGIKKIMKIMEMYPRINSRKFSDFFLQTKQPYGLNHSPKLPIYFLKKCRRHWRWCPNLKTKNHGRFLNKFADIVAVNFNIKFCKGLSSDVHKINSIYLQEG